MKKLALEFSQEDLDRIEEVVDRLGLDSRLEAEDEEWDSAWLEADGETGDPENPEPLLPFRVREAV